MKKKQFIFVQNRLTSLSVLLIFCFFQELFSLDASSVQGKLSTPFSEKIDEFLGLGQAPGSFDPADPWGERASRQELLNRIFKRPPAVLPSDPVVVVTPDPDEEVEREKKEQEKRAQEAEAARKKQEEENRKKEEDRKKKKQEELERKKREEEEKRQKVNTKKNEHAALLKTIETKKQEIDTLRASTDPLPTEPKVKDQSLTEAINALQKFKTDAEAYNNKIAVKKAQLALLVTEYDDSVKKTQEVKGEVAALDATEAQSMPDQRNLSDDKKNITEKDVEVTQAQQKLEQLKKLQTEAPAKKNEIETQIESLKNKAAVFVKKITEFQTNDIADVQDLALNDQTTEGSFTAKTTELNQVLQAYKTKNSELEAIEQEITDAKLTDEKTTIENLISNYKKLFTDAEIKTEEIAFSDDQKNLPDKLKENIQNKKDEITQKLSELEKQVDKNSKDLEAWKADQAQKQEVERKRQEQEELERKNREEEEEKKKQEEAEAEKKRLEQEEAERKKQEEAERQRQESEAREKEEKNNAFDIANTAVSGAISEFDNLATNFPTDSSKAQEFIDLKTNSSGKSLSDILTTHKTVLDKQTEIIATETEKLKKAKETFTEALNKLQVANDALTDASKKEAVKDVINNFTQQEQQQFQAVQDKITALETEKANVETKVEELTQAKTDYDQKHQAFSGLTTPDPEPLKKTFKDLSDTIEGLKTFNEKTLVTTKAVTEKITKIDNLLKTGGQLAACQADCNQMTEQLEKKMAAAKEVADLFATGGALADWAQTSEGSAAKTSYTDAKDAYNQYSATCATAKFDELKNELETKKQALQKHKDDLDAQVSQKKNDHTKTLVDITAKKTAIDNELKPTLGNKPVLSNLSNKTLAQATTEASDFIQKANEYNQNVSDKQSKLAQLLHEHKDLVEKAQKEKGEIQAIDDDAGKILVDQVALDPATQNIPETALPETEITSAQTKLDELTALPGKIEKAKNAFNLQKKEFSEKVMSFSDALNQIDTDASSPLPDSVADDKKAEKDFDDLAQKLTELKDAWEQKQKNLDELSNNSEHGTAALAQQAVAVQKKLDEYNTLFSAQSLVQEPSQQLSFDNKTDDLNKSLGTKKEAIKDFIAKIETAISENSAAKSAWEVAEAERQRQEQEKKKQEEERRKQEEELKRQEAERQKKEQEKAEAEQKKLEQEEEKRKQEEKERQKQEEENRLREEERKKTEKKRELEGLATQLGTKLQGLTTLKSNIDSNTLSVPSVPAFSGKQSITQGLEAYRKYQTEIEQYEKNLTNKNQLINDFNAKVTEYQSALDNFNTKKEEATKLGVNLAGVSDPDIAPQQISEETSGLTGQEKTDVATKISQLETAKQAWDSSNIKTESETLNVKITGNKDCYKVKCDNLKQKIDGQTLPDDKISAEAYKNTKKAIEDFGKQINNLETNRSSLETEKNNFEAKKQELSKKLEAVTIGSVSLTELDDLNALTIADLSPTTVLTSAKETKLQGLEALKTQKISNLKTAFDNANTEYKTAKDAFDTTINELSALKVLGQFGGSTQIASSSIKSLEKYSEAVKAKKAAEELREKAQESYEAYTNFIKNVGDTPPAEVKEPLAVDPDEKINNAFNAVKDKIAESVDVWEKEKKAINKLTDDVKKKYDEFLKEKTGLLASTPKNFETRKREYEEYNSALQEFKAKINKQEVKDKTALIQNIHNHLSNSEFKRQKTTLAGVASMLVNNPQKQVSELNTYFQGLSNLLATKGVDVEKAKTTYESLVRKQEDEEKKKQLEEEAARIEAGKKEQEVKEKQQKITKISGQIEEIDGELATIKNNFETKQGSLPNPPTAPTEQKKATNYKNAQAAIDAYKNYKNDLATQKQSYDQQLAELQTEITSYAEKITERKTQAEELKNLDSAAIDPQDKNLPEALSLSSVPAWLPTVTDEVAQTIIDELSKKQSELEKRMQDVSTSLSTFKGSREARSLEVENLKEEFKTIKAPVDNKQATVDELAKKKEQLAKLKTNVESKITELNTLNKERDRIDEEQKSIKSFWTNFKINNTPIKIDAPAISTSDRDLPEVTSLLNDLRKDRFSNRDDGLKEQVEQEIKTLENAIEQKKKAAATEQLEREQENNSLENKKTEHENLIKNAQEKLSKLSAAQQSLNAPSQPPQGDQGGQKASIDQIIKNFEQNIATYKAAQEAFAKEYESVDKCYEKINKSREELDNAIGEAKFLDDAQKTQQKIVQSDSAFKTNQSLYQNAFEPEVIEKANKKLEDLKKFQAQVSKNYEDDLKTTNDSLTEKESEFNQLSGKVIQTIPEKGDDGNSLLFTQKLKITEAQKQALQKLEKIKSDLDALSLSELENNNTQIDSLASDNDLKPFKLATTSEYVSWKEFYEKVTAWKSKKTDVQEQIEKKIAEAQASLKSNQEAIKGSAEQKQKGWEDDLAKKTKKLSELEEAKIPTLTGILSVVKKDITNYLETAEKYNQDFNKIKKSIEEANEQISHQKKNINQISAQMGVQLTAETTSPQQAPTLTKSTIAEAVITLYTQIKDKLEKASSSYAPLKNEFGTKNQELAKAYESLASTQLEIATVIAGSKENIFADTNITEKIANLKKKAADAKTTLTSAIDFLKKAEVDAEGAKKKVDELFGQTNKEINELIKNAPKAPEGDATSPSPVVEAKITPDDDFVLTSATTGQKGADGADIVKTFGQIQSELNAQLESVNKRIELKRGYNELLISMQGVDTYMLQIIPDKLAITSFNDTLIETISGSTVTSSEKLKEIKKKIESQDSTAFLSEEEKSGYLAELEKQEEKLEGYKTTIENARKSRALINKIKELEKLSRDFKNLKTNQSTSLATILQKKQEFKEAHAQFEKALNQVPAEFKTINYPSTGKNKKTIEKYCEDLEASHQKITEFFAKVEAYDNKIKSFDKDSFANNADGLLNYYNELQNLKTGLMDQNSDYSVTENALGMGDVGNVQQQIKQQAQALANDYLNNLPKSDEDALNYLDSGDESPENILSKVQALAQITKSLSSDSEQETPNDLDKKIQEQKKHKAFAEYFRREFNDKDKKQVILGRITTGGASAEKDIQLNKTFSYEIWLDYYLKAFSKINPQEFEKIKNDSSYALLQTAITADMQRQQLNLEKTFVGILITNGFAFTQSQANTDVSSQKNFLHVLLSLNDAYTKKEVYEGGKQPDIQERIVTYLCNNYKQIVTSEETQKVLLNTQDEEGDTPLHKLIKKLGTDGAEQNVYDQAIFEPIINWLSGLGVLQESETKELLNKKNNAGLTPLGQAFMSCPDGWVLDTLMTRMGWENVGENGAYVQKCSSIQQKTHFFLDHLLINNSSGQAENEKNKNLLESYFKIITDKLGTLYSEANKTTQEETQKAYRYFYLDGSFNLHKENVVPENYYLVKAIKTGNLEIVKYFGEKFKDTDNHNFSDSDHLYNLLENILKSAITSKNIPILKYIFLEFFKKLHNGLKDKKVNFTYKETGITHEDPICHLFDRMIGDQSTTQAMKDFLGKLKSSFDDNGSIEDAVPLEL